ncbi:MAG: tRNA (adenosine(37)-N6)-threonylcarbamoyltransferase complex dimerization subunit type 1 TsaB [Candidatus Komeilibacteria bacterium]|nr:tRNA (adenosine(37)-N6)-threonylcarbamoyltransferase complex dimerization subunit type 1 TsaB [Candidatus Komeilibacteria bacterium]
MILFINTSKTDLIQVKLIKDNKILAQAGSREQFKQSELLLSLIDKVKGTKKLTAIAVVSGPGAFSALRLGIATANALAWSLHIPVIEVSAEEAIDEKLFDILKNKTAGKDFKPIVPKYGREPNITAAKK